MSKFYRLFLKILLGFFVLLLVVQILVSLIGDHYAGNWIKNRISTSSDSLYSLQYDDLDIGLFSGSVQFHNLRFSTDTTAWPDTLSGEPTIVNGKVKDFELHGISLWQYLFSNSLAISSVTFNRPNINITPGRLHPGKKKEKKSSFSSVDSSVYNSIHSQFHALSIGQFAIKNGQFVTHKMESPVDTSFWGNGFNLRLHDIHVDSSTAQLKRLFPTDEVQCSIEHFGQHLPDKLYKLSLQHFRLSSSDHSLSIDSLQFLPRYPKYEFSRRHGTQIDRISLTVPHIRFQGINFDQSINQRLFYAKSGKIDQPRLEVFHDKSMPPPPSHPAPPLPYITFKNMKTKVKIDSVSISNGYISYSEQRTKLSEPGTVSFENLSATFMGISNYEEDLADDYKVRIKTHSKVMGTGNLDVNFTFPMGENAGRHQIEGTLRQIQATDFNEATENIALVRLTGGIIYHLNFAMNVNKYGAEGSLTADYENLKIVMLKEKNQEAQGRKTIKSFIANTFLVRGDNHTPPLGKAKIHFERKDPNSLYNLWWKSLLSGLKEQFDTM